MLDSSVPAYAVGPADTRPRPADHLPRHAGLDLDPGTAPEADLRHVGRPLPMCRTPGGWARHRQPPHRHWAGDRWRSQGRCRLLRERWRLGAAGRSAVGGRLHAVPAVADLLAHPPNRWKAVRAGPTARARQPLNRSVQTNTVDPDGLRTAS